MSRQDSTTFSDAIAMQWARDKLAGLRARHRRLRSIGIGGGAAEDGSGKLQPNETYIMSTGDGYYVYRSGPVGDARDFWGENLSGALRFDSKEDADAWFADYAKALP